MMGSFEVDDHILWFSDGEPLFGVVKWVGEKYTGIEFDQPVKPSNSAKQSRGEFQAKDGHGLLVPTDELKLVSSKGGIAGRGGNLRRGHGSRGGQHSTSERNLEQHNRGRGGAASSRGRGPGPRGRGGMGPRGGGQQNIPGLMDQHFLPPDPQMRWRQPNAGLLPHPPRRPPPNMGPQRPTGRFPLPLRGPPPGVNPMYPPGNSGEGPYSDWNSGYGYGQQQWGNEQGYHQYYPEQANSAQGYFGARNSRAGSVYDSQESLASNEGSVASRRGRGSHNRGRKNRGRKKRETPQSDTVSRSDRKLFVGGLNKDTTEGSFKQYFQKFGKVEDSFVISSKGFGFVTFASVGSSQSALRANSHTIDGKRVNVEKRKEKKDDETDSDASHDSSAEMSKKLYVGSLDKNSTDESLRRYFKKYGKIEKCFVAKTKDNKKSKCYGFVQFQATYMARNVLLDAPHTVDGQKVQINEFRTNKEDSSESSSDEEELDDDEVMRKAIHALSINEGSEGLSSVASKLGVKVANLKKVISKNKDLFDLNDKNRKVTLRVSLCSNHLSKSGCPQAGCDKFHLCKDFASGSCDFSDDQCEFGHQIDSYHNNKVKETLCLDEVTNQTLLKVLSKTDGVVSTPSVCLAYNKGDCKASDDTCSSLHICLREVLPSQCDEAKCRVPNHDILSKGCKAVLLKKKVPLNQSRKEILTLISQKMIRSKEVDKFLKDIEREKKNRKSFRADNVLEADVEIAEICIPFLNGKCMSDVPGQQCKRLHSKNTYHWQVSSGGKWYNLLVFHSNQIEQSFIDVSTDSVQLDQIDPFKLKSSEKPILEVLGKGTWTANYKSSKFTLVDSSMLKPALELRRLSTSSSAITSSPFATEWFWYFLDEYSKWIAYGQSNTKQNNQSTVDSNSLEKDYQQNPKSSVTFGTPEFAKYSLDFTTMKQKNLQVGTERYVRRRPLSSQSVSSGSTPVVSSEFRHLPKNWTPMPPNKPCILVQIKQATQEYQEIYNFFVTHLQRTPTMQSIERVQNPYLREMYENRKKYMCKCLQKQESQIERRVFHGTDPNNIDAITHQNFDWRLHGSSSGQAYGRGVYFAASATYSDGYARGGTTGYKKMFIAKIIVGNMTPGTSSMIRPPPLPGSANMTCDTSVNNVSNPSIFVKYQDQEMYPEYVITYA